MKWWIDMKISKKLILTLLTLAVLPLTFFTLISYNLASSALLDADLKNLTLVRELKAQQIEDYFLQVRNQVSTFSHSTMTVNAMREFTAAFHAIDEEQEITEDQWKQVESRLNKFYTGEFIPGLEKGLGKKVNIEDYYPEDKHTRLLQDLYISFNPHPIGSKQELDCHDDKSLYGRVHKKYHPLFRDFQEKFGYYDVFLVEASSGYIVYSVFKEIDFATSLLNGPYKSENIADAFRSVIEAGAGMVKLVDFKPYHPSYNSSASFIASAITDENNNVIGALVFQMPIKEINDIMTSHHKWAELGFGHTGETYIVGDDFTVKNQSRHFYEDRDGFLTELKKTAVPGTIIDDIKRVDSVIGRLPVKTNGVVAALQGKKAVDIYPDYLGVPVISAYSPLSITDMKWAIINEKEEQEALAPARRERNLLILITLVITLFVGIAAFFISNKITKPVRNMAEDSRALGDGDLTKTVSVDSRDEIGELGTTLNYSIKQLRNIVSNVKQSIGGITRTAEEIAEGGTDLASRSNQQAASVTETSAVIEQFSDALKESSENAVTTKTKLEEFFLDIQSKMELIENVTLTMKEIGQSGSRIDNFIGVINDISFQTNLLALNAAVEAARAGEAGRGFAVVAAEVRNLAQKTAEASKNIQVIVSNNVESTSRGMELVTQTSEFFDSIHYVMKDVSEKVQSIAHSSREQETGVEQIKDAILQLEEVINQNAALAEEFSSSVSSLRGNTRELENMVARFKLDENTE